VAVHRAAEKTIPALDKWCGGPNLDFRSRADAPRWNPTALDRIVWHEKSAKSLRYSLRKRSERNCRENKGVIAMPRENDLEGAQDQGGKHGGQKGMPKPEPRPATSSDLERGGAPDQGIVRDERGQEQPQDKERAQQVSRTDPIRR
jgi:hypothetical protein